METKYLGYRFSAVKITIIVFGFGSQAFVCGFSRQNICSVCRVLRIMIKFLIFFLQSIIQPDNIKLPYIPMSIMYLTSFVGHRVSLLSILIGHRPLHWTVVFEENYENIKN